MVVLVSFGGWIRARGLNCHSFVDSKQGIRISKKLFKYQASSCFRSIYILPIRVCFGLSGTLGGSAEGGWSRLEVGGFGAGLAGKGRDSIRDWSLEGVRILLGGLAAGTLSPKVLVFRRTLRYQDCYSYQRMIE